LISSLSSKPGTKFVPFQQKENLHEIPAHEFIQTYSHELEDLAMQEQNNNFDLPYKFEFDDDPPEISDTKFVNAANLSIPDKLSPGDIQQLV
jgi:hypothetical protein